MWFFFFSLLRCITLTDFQILNHLCIPGISPIWLWCTIFFLHIFGFDLLIFPFFGGGGYLFAISRAAPMAHGGSQARGRIGAVAAGGIRAMSATYTTAHGNTGSLTRWSRPGIKPTTSWFLVGFINHWATTGTPDLLIFHQGFCIYVHERYWFVVYLNVFFWFWCWGDAGFIECVRKYFLCFYLLKEIVDNW